MCFNSIVFFKKMLKYIGFVWALSYDWLEWKSWIHSWNNVHLLLISRLIFPLMRCSMTLLLWRIWFLRRPLMFFVLPNVEVFHSNVCLDTFKETKLMILLLKINFKRWRANRATKEMNIPRFKVSFLHAIFHTRIQWRIQKCAPTKCSLILSGFKEIIIGVGAPV